MFRFWHLADLHLTSDGKASTRYGPSDKIKGASLATIAEHLRQTPSRPDLIIVSGDILESSFDTAVDAARLLAPLIVAADDNGVALVGVTGEHDEYGETRTRAVFEKDLGWEWLLGAGEHRDVRGVRLLGVPSGPRQSKAKSTICSLRTGAHSGPVIVVAHASRQNILKSAPIFKRCTYAALGDRHVLTRHDLGHAIGAYPGHLFSYWDGSGKAWPTFMIEGTIDSDEAVRLTPMRLDLPPFNGPSTRQFYVPHRCAGMDAGMLVLVNPPENYVLDGIPDLLHEEQRAVLWSPDISLRRLKFHYETASEMRRIITSILEACPEDIFVSPAPATGLRSMDTGLQSLSNLDRLIRNTGKKSPETQTSDVEATGASYSWVSARGQTM